MTEDNLHTKVDLENVSPAFAKPVLYAGADFGGLISLYNEDCLQNSNFNAMVALAYNGFGLGEVRVKYTKTFD